MALVLACKPLGPANYYMSSEKGPPPAKSSDETEAQADILIDILRRTQPGCAYSLTHRNSEIINVCYLNRKVCGNIVMWQ